MINRNRDIQFYTVDTFQGDSGSNDIKEVEAYKQVNISKMHEEFKENTKHLEGTFTVIKDYSWESAKLFEDNSVDVCFLDASHSVDSVLLDLHAWYPKIKNNGILAGHDYNAWAGVKTAFKQYFKTDPDKIDNDCWFIKIIK